MTLTPKGYRPRMMDQIFRQCLDTFGCVYVRGPKNSGKTWMCRNQCASEIQLDADMIELVRLDRMVALNGDAPHLIDEWQTVPSLWDDVRFQIDRTGANGQYVLCGSFTLSEDEEKKRLHSGIGRIYTLDIRPMSLYESGDSSGTVSLMGMFDGEFANQACEPIGIEHLIYLAARGGWPSLIDGNGDYARANRDYVDKICEEDCSGIDGVRRNGERMLRVVRSLARNESTVVKNSRIMSDIREFDDESISENTLADYLSALERLHAIWSQPAFDPNFRSDMRVGKSPKRHLIDPSLSIAALRLTPQMLMNDLKTLGFMFEGLCERDLAVYAEAHDATLFHYRDGRGNEIDAVIELPDGRWGAFEIKLGYSQADAAAENLLRMKKLFEEKGARPPSLLCVICGLSRMAVKRPDGVFVVPITCLKD